jgi:hypothetical protein
MISVHEKRRKTGNRQRTHGDTGERHSGGNFRDRRVTVNSGQYLYGPTKNKNKSMNTRVISCKQRENGVFADGFAETKEERKQQEQSLPFRVTGFNR